MFTHLHWHSTFSFLESIWNPKDIAQKAKNLWMSAIALTDYNAMYGAINFYLKAKDIEIKPIIGVELGFVVDIETFQDVKKIGNICLLAYNKTGYYNLLKLTAFAHMQGLEWTPKITYQALKDNAEGLIVFMWWSESRIGKKIFYEEKQDKIIEIITMLKDTLWAKNVYAEIIAQDYLKVPNLEKINTRVLEIAKAAKIKCIIGTDYHYINKEDKEAREMALAIKDGLKMYDDHRRKPAGEYHIATESEITAILESNGFGTGQIQERVNNNNTIAEKVTTEIDLYQSLFPNYETPSNMAEKYEKCKDSLVEKE